ncbi:class I tRNA ligase family protein [Chlamydiota bacterium]
MVHRRVFIRKRIDSGVSHHAVLRERKELQFPADLYLEGSDQHRGWFQTSLLTSMGTHNRPPFKTVLTHGFVVDGEGKKMSKSTGNVISPEQVMKKYGADILRLWVCSTDYSSDARMSESILQQIADSYRRVRNTFRFLLGNLYDFDPSKNAVAIPNLEEIDKWALSKTYSLLKQITTHFDSFQFYKAYQQIYDFCNLSMSSFYLDILKDTLYTLQANAQERRSAQTVFSTIITVLNKVLAPILSFTCEEIFAHLSQQTDCNSIHLTLWPLLDEQYIDKTLEEKWDKLAIVRSDINRVIESLRKDKIIGNSLECEVILYITDETLFSFLQLFRGKLESLFMVSKVILKEGKQKKETAHRIFEAQAVKELFICAYKTNHQKCQRCWRYTDDIGKNTAHPTICLRCIGALSQ